MNIRGLAARVSVKTKGGAKPLRLVLVLEFVVDAADLAFYAQMRTLLPEIDAVTKSHEDADDADSEDKERTIITLPSHRLGGGSHTVTVWNLPTNSRMPEAVPFLELGQATLDKEVRITLGGGMPRVRIEVIERASHLVSVDLPTMAKAHNSDMWLDFSEHQVGLDSANEAAAGVGKRKGKGAKGGAKQANLFPSGTKAPAAEPGAEGDGTPPAEADVWERAGSPEGPTYDQAVDLWETGGAAGRILLTEQGDEPFEATGPSRDLHLMDLPEEAIVRIAFGSLGGHTRWWVIGRMQNGQTLGWWAHPVPTATPDEETADTTIPQRPQAPAEEQAVNEWVNGDEATRVLAHNNAGLSLEQVCNTLNLELDAEADTPEGRVLGIVWGRISGIEGWFALGLWETGSAGEAGWWAHPLELEQPGDDLTEARGELVGTLRDRLPGDPEPEPGTITDAAAYERARAAGNVTELRPGGQVRVRRVQRDVSYEPDTGLAHEGDGEAPEAEEEEGDAPEVVWEPWNLANLKQLAGTGQDKDGYDALDRYAHSLTGVQLKAQLVALGAKVRATSLSRLQTLLLEKVRGVGGEVAEPTDDAAEG